MATVTRLAALFVLAFACLGIAQRSTTAPAPIALVGGTIYVDARANPIRDGVVLIENGTIRAVGDRRTMRLQDGTQILDCSGLTITAGFWNSHVHFLERKWADAGTTPAANLEGQLQEMLTRYGFTSVWDTWSVWDNTRRIRDRIESGEIAGPRIHSTGEAIFGPINTSAMAGAWDSLGFIPLSRFQVAQVADDEESIAAVSRLLDSGTDGVKFYAATPGRNSVTVPQSAIRAGTLHAHNRKAPVFAHPTSEAGLLASLNAGVDVVSHTTPQSGPWTESIIAAMKRSGVAVIPTLKLWKYEFRHEPIALGDTFKATAEGQVRAWTASGGVVLFGTDVGYMSEYDPTDEYVFMAEAGMNFRDILTSLTTSPATRFGASQRLGRIAIGLTADLTVLRHDPSRDVRAFAAVEYTFRDGRIIYRRPSRDYP